MNSCLQDSGPDTSLIVTFLQLKRSPVLVVFHIPLAIRLAHFNKLFKEQSVAFNSSNMQSYIYLFLIYNMKISLGVGCRPFSN